MPVSRTFLMLATIALGISASGCSQIDASHQLMENETAQREFSPAEKEAARALSIIGSTAPSDVGVDPFDGMLRCHAALVALRKEFGEGRAQGETAALIQAEQFFERRVQEQGAAAGRQPAQIEAAMRQSIEERTSISESARIALGCVRQLQR